LSLPDSQFLYLCDDTIVTFERAYTCIHAEDLNKYITSKFTEVIGAKYASLNKSSREKNLGRSD
jgi:hypothetical protein